MNSELILMLVAAYLRKLITPTETDAETADGITDDLRKFRTYLNSLNKNGIR